MSSRAWGGLILLLLFVAVMSRCQGPDVCDKPDSEAAIEQCQQMRP